MYVVFLSKRDNYQKIKVDFIFQDNNLFEELTVRQNLKLALQVNGKNQSNKEINYLLKSFDIKKINETKLAKKLSSGEKQKIAVLRSLIRDFDLLLVDEPTGNLDQKNSEIVFKKLLKISKTKPIIIVTHDLVAAEKYASRILKIKDGKVKLCNEKVINEKKLFLLLIIIKKWNL